MPPIIKFYNNPVTFQHESLTPAGGMTVNNIPTFQITSE